MIIKFEGKGCKGCPFFWVEYHADLRKCEEVDWTCCTLTGNINHKTGEMVKIKLGRDFKRKGACPFKKGEKVEVINGK